MTLADGSTIDMNARSRIRIRFSKHARDVDLLDGQALLTVAKDSARPFTVSSDYTRVRAIGTQFVVYRRRSGTTVTVLEGKVSVLPGGADGPADACWRCKPDGGQPPRSSIEARRPTATRLSDGRRAGDDERAHPDGSASRGHDDSDGLDSAADRLPGRPLTEVVEEFNRYNLRQMIIRARTWRTCASAASFFDATGVTAQISARAGRPRRRRKGRHGRYLPALSRNVASRQRKQIFRERGIHQATFDAHPQQSPDVRAGQR